MVVNHVFFYRGPDPEPDPDPVFSGKRVPYLNLIDFEREPGREIVFMGKNYFSMGIQKLFGWTKV